MEDYFTFVNLFSYLVHMCVIYLLQEYSVDSVCVTLDLVNLELFIVSEVSH